MSKVLLISPRKKKLLIVTFGFILPFILLALGELFLWLFDYGTPTSFFVKRNYHKKVFLSTNYLAASRFFPGYLARKPLPEIFTIEKMPNEFRVFIIGESAARGESLSDFSFARMLEEMLKVSYPNINFKVINTAIPAINSWVIREQAKELVKYSPDLIVFYGGHNEIVGPYGPGTVFQKIHSNFLIDFGIFLTSTRIGQAIKNFSEAIISVGERRSWQGLEMFMKNLILPNDPRIKQSAENFFYNIYKIAKLCQKHKILFIFGTAGVNLRDFPPFASVHSPNISPEDLKAWNEAFLKGDEAIKNENYTKALQFYASAEKIDSFHADLHYRMAVCKEKIGDFQTATIFYKKALENDALRFRATKVFQDALNKLKESFQNDPFIKFIDWEKAFFDSSPDGIPGAKYFYDHVHLTIEGHYLIATKIYKELIRSGKLGITQTSSEPISLDECLTRLGFTLYDEKRHLENFIANFKKPPFSTIWNHSILMNRLEEKLTFINKRLVNSNEATLATYTKALSLNPYSKGLLMRYALFLYEIGELKRALTFYEKAFELNPFDIDILNNRGYVLLQCGDLISAYKDFTEAVRLAPNFAKGFFNLAVLETKRKNNSAAKHWYNKTLEIDPEFIRARLNLGNILFGEGKYAEALEQYQAVVKIDPQSEEGYLSLGNAFRKLGKIDKAREAYFAGLKVNPHFGPIYYSLAQLEINNRNFIEAKNWLTKTISVASNDPPLMKKIALTLATSDSTTIKDDKLALELISRIENIQGNIDPELRKIEAVALASLGRLDEARQSLNNGLIQANALNNNELAQEFLSLINQLETTTLLNKNKK